MKFLCLFLINLFLLLGFSAQAMSLQGYVFYTAGQYFYVDSDNHRSYLLKASNPEAQMALSKLKSFDSLLGHGTAGPQNMIYLDSIDFVSLRRLIGIWKDPSAVVNFVDYQRVSFYSKADKQSSDYSYVLAPAEGDNWRIFFTDRSSVVLGSLTVKNTKAQIELYDSSTGEVAQRFDLKKINP